jgi:hypothetical protein
MHFRMGGRGILAHTICDLVFPGNRRVIANTAEEVVRPQRTLLVRLVVKPYSPLVILCVLIFISSIGVAGWEAIVYKANGQTSDSPLPWPWPT